MKKVEPPLDPPLIDIASPKPHYPVVRLRRRNVYQWADRCGRIEYVVRLRNEILSVSLVRVHNRVTRLRRRIACLSVADLEGVPLIDIASIHGTPSRSATDIVSPKPHYPVVHAQVTHLIFHYVLILCLPV